MLLLETRALVDTLVAERDALASQNERLQHLLLKLKRRQFGQKSEQLPEEQLLFAFEEIEATLAGNAAEGAKASPALRDGQRKRRRAGRGRLPAHLPRVEVVLVPEASACPCCRGPLVEIGVDAAERLDVIPAQFRVIVTKRPKLACRACAGVVLQAPAPARLIEGGVPTEATVAHVLVSRYADHLPLYRQAQILARQGIEIGREVLADWTGTAAMEIVPVVRRPDGMFGPKAVAWRVHGDVTSMMVGGIASLLLQMLHPAVLAGVWDHSNFRTDMHGRLRRTARFIALTTYGGRDEAEKVIARVRKIHDRVGGILQDGTPYAANDPALLAWVHVTEATCFLNAWRRYVEPGMSLVDQNRYFAEMAQVARALGAAPVPSNRVEARRLIETYRPQLRVRRQHP